MCTHVRAFVGAMLSMLSVAHGAAPDYARVFARFDAFHPPNVATAAYVKVSCWEAGIEDLLPWGHDTGGNAWMIAETRDSEGRQLSGTFVVNGAEQVTLHAARLQQWTRRDPVSPPTDEEPVLYGTWAPANLSNDIRRVMRYLQAAEFPSQRFGSDTGAELFLFAHQLQQRSDRDAAHAILERLFLRDGGPEAVVLSAVDRLADGQYREVYRRFRTDGNWAAYHRGVRELLDRYPKGWSARPGVALLAASIARRMVDPAPLPDKTNALSSASLDLARRMANLRSVRSGERYSSADVLWLIPSTWRERARVTGDVDLEIRALGAAAISFLLALADDTSLTAVHHEPPEDYGLPRERSGEDAAAIFAKLARPATRGEVAQRILSDIAPGRWRGEDGPSLLAASRVYDEEIRGMSDDELAARFLRDKDAGLREIAAESLLRAARLRPVAALEKQLLAPLEQDYDGYGSGVASAASERATCLAKYAALRGSEARPLVQSFMAMLEQAAAAYEKPANVSYGGAEQDREHVESVRKKIRATAQGLAALPYDRATDELVDDVARRAGKQQPDSLEHAMLVARLQSMSRTDAAGLLLAKACASAPAERTELATLLRTTLAPQPGEEELGATEHDALWRQLVQLGGDEAATRAAEVFLCLNEELFAPSEPTDRDAHMSYFVFERPDSPWQLAGRPAAGLIRDYGTLGRELVHARVLARLAGQPESAWPKYPSERPLSDAESAAVKRALSKARTQAEAVTAFNGLSIYARAALPTLLAGDAKLNAKLTDFGNVITRVSVRDDAELAARLAPWQGRLLTTNLIHELLAYTERRSRQNAPVLCMVLRSEGFTGCEVIVHTNALVTVLSEDGKARSQPIEGLAGLVCAPDNYAAVTWRTAPPPEKPNWRTLVTSRADDLAAFDAAVDRISHAGVPASALAFVRISSTGEITRR